MSVATSSIRREHANLAGRLCPVSPEELAFLMQAAMAAQRSHRFRDARTIFTGVRALDPASTNAEIGLGSVDFSEGHFSDAIRHYCQALRLNPRSAYAWALLGESQMFQDDYVGARKSLGCAREFDTNGPYGRLAQSLLQLLLLLESRKPTP